MSGLGAAMASKLPIYEATNRPGGVCYSYYVDEGGTRRDPRVDNASRCFRFEPAGGHWLFGVSQASLRRLEKFCTFNKYERLAAVHFWQTGQSVPYPIQDNLRYLDPELRNRILAEICARKPHEIGKPASLKLWLLSAFGPTLCQLFFLPFNERYTAGMLDEIEPQDLYKSAIDQDRVRRGAFESAEDNGYNRVFYYPSKGLDHLISEISASCSLHLEHRVSHIDTRRRKAYFANRRELCYDRIISTIPLDRMMQLCEMECGPPDPATAVLVVNIAGVKGRNCPSYHWVYLPSSRSGIHRIGFYSHVDELFLPAKYRGRSDIVSIYAERSFASGAAPSAEEQVSISRAVVDELRDFEFIQQAIVVDSTFTDPAYTWSRPGSTWAQRAIQQLHQVGIRQIGRYGAWQFQGMVELFEQGLFTSGTRNSESREEMDGSSAASA